MTKQIYFADPDPAMQAASAAAIRTFKYFWREMSWESRRIIPGVGLGVVKIPFPTTRTGNGIPVVEHLWFNEVQFDGVTISGTLLNNPRWIEGLHAGERRTCALAEISDWMYTLKDRVFGGFTVQTLRRQMRDRECREHDQAWGLDFGDPHKPFIAPREPVKNPRDFLGFSKGPEGYLDGEAVPEHPMSLNMAEKCEQAMLEDPAPFLEKNAAGSSMLHFDALAGNATQVKILLAHGADADMTDRNGMTPLALAQALQWERVVQLLTQPRS